MILLFTACASAPRAPTGGPRGMRASDHLDAARQHDEAAVRHSTWPEPTAIAPGSPPTTTGLPWFRTWDTTAEHERLAVSHRSRAQAIHAAYDEACGTRPLEVVSVSPLRRYGTGGWNTASGVIVYLSDAAGNPDHLLAELACHRAWMMLAPAGMDDCPLDLPGLVLDARGDASGVTLSLSMRDPKLVGELQRRAALDLEAAHTR